MFRKIARYILSFGFSLLITHVVSIFILPYAYSIRGYQAIGGEHFLLLFIFISLFYFTAPVEK